MAEAVQGGPGGAAVAWHAVAANEVIGRLNTDEARGLDAGEASRRLSRYGPNRLPEGKKRGPLMRFMAQLNNILVYVLLAAGFVKLTVGLWLDAAVILGVVLINAVLGFLQEGKAEKAFDSIRNMLSAEARTVRGGETRLIPAEELVPGDVVLLESGDRIPADLRLVDVKNLRTEEAALTGESVPIDKTTAAVTERATVGDREGMAFSGTLVSSGRGKGVVVATGSETELGRINQLMAGVSALDTPLLRQIKKFGYAITAVIAVVAAIVFAYGRWVRGMDFVPIFQAVVSIAVSVIPEGLPALITVTLAIGVQRMAQRNAIIRRLPAVETLGSVSRICSDKTGTLTLMEMMVASAVTAQSVFKVTGEGYAPAGEVLTNGASVSDDPVLKLMGRVSLLCNDAEIRQEEGTWKVEGDPTEGALFPFAQQARPRTASRGDRLSEGRYDPVRVGASLHGDAAPGCRRRTVPFGEGGAGGDPRTLRSAGNERRTAGAPRPQPFRAGVGRARGAGRARAGARLVRRSWARCGDPRSRRSADEPRALGPRRLARSAAHGSDRGGGGVPSRRHPRDDDYRRPPDHRGRDRQAVEDR